MTKKSVFQRSDNDVEKVGRFVAGSSVALVTTVVSGSMSFIWTIVMTRSVGPEGFGLVKPFLDIFWILCGAVSLGIPQALQAMISGFHQNEPESADAVMADGSKLLFIIGALFSCAAVGAAVIFRHSMSPLVFKFIILMTIAVIARQMYFAFFGILGGLQRIDLVSTCNLLFPSTMLAASSALVSLATRAGAPLETKVLAGVAGIPVAATIQYLAALIIAPRSGAKLAVIYSWGRPRGMARKILSFGWVASVAIVAVSTVSFIAPAVISNLAHSRGFFGGAATGGVNAGYFSGGFSYALAPMLIVGMFFALLPAISEAHAQSNRDLMQLYFTLAARYTSLVIIYVLTVYCVYAGIIVQTFSGEKFPAPVLGKITFVLAGGMSLNMVSTFFINLLIGMKKPAPAAIASLCMFMMLPPALILTANKYDSIFAEAVAFDAVSLFGAVSLGVIFIRVSGLKFPWSHFLRSAAAALAAGAILSALPAGTLWFLAGLAISFPVYMLFMGWTGGINSGDYKLLENVISSPKMAPFSIIVKAARSIASISPLFK